MLKAEGAWVCEAEGSERERARLRALGDETKRERRGRRVQKRGSAVPTRPRQGVGGQR